MEVIPKLLRVSCIDSEVSAFIFTSDAHRTPQMQALSGSGS